MSFYGPLKPENDLLLVRLNRQSRAMLRLMAERLEEILKDEHTASDSAVARLFPHAYNQDEDLLRNLDFERGAGSELLNDRLTDLNTVIDTSGAKYIDDEQAMAWMRTANAMRLVIGTRLQLTEESTREDYESDPETLQAYEMYDFLSWLIGGIVICVSPGTEQDPQ